jgi:hypothetical protein
MEKSGADHEVLSLYIESFNRMFAQSSPQVMRDAAEAVKLFLTRKVVDHFAYEERHIFPALLQANPGEGVRNRVSEIQAEHKLLLKEAKRLDKILAQEELAYDRAGFLRKAMLDFLHHLEKHASRENALFPSLM